MAIPVLNDLHKEIKRLLAAGSILACDDFGLKKLLPQLKKMGESAPVFSKLAVKVEELIKDSENSEEKLLELASLVNAILYTQGTWEIKGDIENIDIVDNDGTTDLSYRKLRPIIEALTSKGPGRYNILLEAYNEGIFHKKDKRLILPIIKALEDTYFEITELLLEKVVPLNGDVILPILKTHLDMKGGRASAIKLKAIHRICGKSEMELYKTASEQGSVDIRLAAMQILDIEKAPDDIFVELAKDKKKDIREAAEAVLEGRKTGLTDKLFRIFGYR